MCAAAVGSFSLESTGSDVARAVGSVDIVCAVSSEHDRHLRSQITPPCSHAFQVSLVPPSSHCFFSLAGSN